MADTVANLIIKKLKTTFIWNKKEGEESNIILFSDIDVFSITPYVVVKPESGILENTRAYRIIVHMNKGELDILENFVLVKLDKLLLSDYLKDNDGGRYKLRASGYTDVTPEKMDNSYFMERLYFVPLTIRD
jgi:hypothetical protein